MLPSFSQGSKYIRLLPFRQPLVIIPKLNVSLIRDREKGDDTIRISYREDPFDPVDVRRALIAIQRQFVPLNHAEALARALGPEMANFYRLREESLSRLEKLTGKIVKETHDYRMRLGSLSIGNQSAHSPTPPRQEPHRGPRVYSTIKALIVSYVGRNNLVFQTSRCPTRMIAREACCPGTSYDRGFIHAREEGGAR